MNSPKTGLRHRFDPVTGQNGSLSSPAARATRLTRTAVTPTVHHYEIKKFSGSEVTASMKKDFEAWGLVIRSTGFKQGQ